MDLYIWNQHTPTVVRNHYLFRIPCDIPWWYHMDRLLDLVDIRRHLLRFFHDIARWDRKDSASKDSIQSYLSL